MEGELHFYTELPSRRCSGDVAGGDARSGVSTDFRPRFKCLGKESTLAKTRLAVDQKSHSPRWGAGRADGADSGQADQEPRQTQSAGSRTARQQDGGRLRIGVGSTIVSMHF